MAMFVVLLMVSLAVGLCYSAMRSQYTVAMIQRNSDRRVSARQAALTGINMALRKMQTNAWAGVNTSISGTISSTETFQASYASGDASLPGTNPDQPYRVTVLSKGFASDPLNPASTASYQIRAVVRLAPRKLASQPADWPGMANYTVYQTRREDVNIDIPCRIVGAVRLQKRLRVPYQYPDDSNAKTRYCNDLNLMRQAGLDDYRPFNGPIHFPHADQDGTFFTLLTTMLGVSTVNTAAQEVGSSWTFPAYSTTYRIYPGGPEYTMQTAPSSLEAATLAPDPTINPLGMFYRAGNITLNANAVVQGSLACTGDVILNGSNVSLGAVNLPPLAGTTTPIRLATVCADDITVKGSGGQINGLAVVFDQFLVDDGSVNNTFTLAGKLVTRRLEIQERTNWNIISWSTFYAIFQLQLGLPSPDIYFPRWMGSKGYSPVPKIIFAPENSPVTYHWATAYETIFVPHPDDGGLRWNLMVWSEEQ